MSDKYKFCSSTNRRDATGTINCVIVLEDTNGVRITVEVPYNPAYASLSNDTWFSTDIVGTSVTLYREDDSTLNNIGRLIVCPYCNYPLINIEEGYNSNLYCCNPGCHENGDMPGKLFFILTVLNIHASNEELQALIEFMKFYKFNDFHFISVAQALADKNVINPTCRNIRNQIKAILKNGLPSDFLKILSIPDIYYDRITVFDTMFSTVEDFHDAMHNYRRLNQVMVGYDSNMMSLIYSNLFINNKLVTEYFNMRNHYCLEV